MVKAYFNYSFEKPVGQLISPNCNIVSSGTHVFCGVNQYIAVVNIRTREVEAYLYKPNKHVPVRCLAIDLEKSRLFSGYEDGEIIVWDLISQECEVIDNAHKGAVLKIEIIEIKNPITTIK